MRKIGFTEVYYTLWDVEERHIVNDWGEYIVYYAKFIKNISKDLDTAKSKYPDLEFDDTLRGHSYIKRTTCVKTFDNPKQEQPIDVFHFGKYSNQPIAECTDYGYLYWYYQQVKDEHKICVSDALVKSGLYGYYGDQLYEMSYVDELNARDAKVVEILEGLESNNPIKIQSISNIFVWYNSEYEEEYRYSTTDVYGIRLIWDANKTLEYMYDGREYFLPEKNGKGKRIKNKTLSIVADKYEVKDTNCGKHIDIYVKDFNVL